MRVLSPFIFSLIAPQPKQKPMIFTTDVLKSIGPRFQDSRNSQNENMKSKESSGSKTSECSGTTMSSLEESNQKTGNKLDKIRLENEKLTRQLEQIRAFSGAKAETKEFPCFQTLLGRDDSSLKRRNCPNTRANPGSPPKQVKEEKQDQVGTFLNEPCRLNGFSNFKSQRKNSQTGFGLIQPNAGSADLEEPKGPLASPGDKEDQLSPFEFTWFPPRQDQELDSAKQNEKPESKKARKNDLISETNNKTQPAPYQTKASPVTSAQKDRAPLNYESLLKNRKCSPSPEKQATFGKANTEPPQKPSQMNKNEIKEEILELKRAVSRYSSNLKTLDMISMRPSGSPEPKTSKGSPENFSKNQNRLKADSSALLLRVNEALSRSKDIIRRSSKEGVAKSNNGLSSSKEKTTSKKEETKWTKKEKSQETKGSPASQWFLERKEKEEKKLSKGPGFSILPLESSGGRFTRQEASFGTQKGQLGSPIAGMSFMTEDVMSEDILSLNSPKSGSEETTTSMIQVNQEKISKCEATSILVDVVLSF